MDALKVGLLAVSAVLVGSLAPVKETRPSPEALAMLDPSRIGRLTCGQLGGDRLRARLAMASAFVGQTPAKTAETFPMLPGAQGVSMPVTTKSDQARRYFHQGMTLAYGFNHAAAIGSFREAQRLDPACALCWWGEAVAHGPNINAPMDPAARASALAAVRKAEALKRKAPPLERALIEAAAMRYSDDPKADRAPLDTAYADAMMKAARQFRDADDVALLAAEAAMDTTPWNYWASDKKTPNPRIGEAVRLVERVSARNPDHPQAAHLYIHLMENSADPRRAEAAADRLARPLVPGAGHLVHMPAHIYYRLGRFGDSIRANVAAARADEAYLKTVGDDGLYRYGYYPHNVHFIVTSAQMAGDMGTAIREAQKLSAVLKPEIAAQIAWTQPIHAAPYLAYAQFAGPDAILDLPAADPRLPYVSAMRHYARAVALARMGDRSGAERELAALDAIRTGTDFSAMIEQGVPAPDLLRLAHLTGRGKIAFAQKRYDDAARLYREAAVVEDAIPYMEPPFWYYPVRQSLGAALYRDGKHDEARDAFRAALAQYPGNAWALYGLTLTERKLGHKLEAAAAEQAFRRAWFGNSNWLRMDRL